MIPYLVKINTGLIYDGTDVFGESHYRNEYEDYLVYGTSKSNVLKKIREELGYSKSKVRFKTIL